jgi:hypothetical protein
MTEYSRGRHVDSSVNVHIIPGLGSRNLNSVTLIVIGRFLDELERDGVGRGNVYVREALRAADEFLALEIVMMVGSGLRNGEADREWARRAVASRRGLHKASAERRPG